MTLLLTLQLSQKLFPEQMQETPDVLSADEDLAVVTVRQQADEVADEDPAIVTILQQADEAVVVTDGARDGLRRSNRLRKKYVLT